MRLLLVDRDSTSKYGHGSYSENDDDEDKNNSDLLISIVARV